MSSALVAGEGTVNNSSSSQPLSYKDWRDSQFDNYFNGSLSTFLDGLQAIPQSLGAGLGIGRYSRDKYNDYLNSFYGGNSPGKKVDLSTSQAGSAKTSALDTMSEREFVKYLTDYQQKLGLEADATKYQRAYQDLLKAGLNPRLAIDSLNGSGVSASSGYSYSQSDTRSQSSSSSDSFSKSGLIVGILALAGVVLKAVL